MDTFPESLLIKILPLLSREVLSLPEDTETPEFESCIHSTKAPEVVFSLEVSLGGFDTEQEVSPRSKTERIIYFIKREVYKVDSKKYRTFFS